MSLALATWVYKQEERLNQANFDSHARAQAVTLDSGMDNAVDAIEDLNQFFIANGGDVSRAQFRLFTQPILARHSYIETFGFQRVVTHEERAQVEKEMRRSFPGFSISTIRNGQRVVAPERDRYCFIDYIAPSVGDELLFGVDTLSLHLYDEAMQRATDSAMAAGSELSPFIRKSKQNAFRILMAVYKDGIVPNSVAARRDAVIGYTIAVLRPYDLIAKIVEGDDSDTLHARFDIRVFSGTASRHVRLAYESIGRTAPADVGWLSTQLKPFSYTFDVAGSSWHVIIESPPLSFLVAHGKAMVAFLLGLAATFALTVYLRLLSIRTQRIEDVVANRTDELKKVNSLLTEDIKARIQAEVALRQSQAELRRLAAHQETVREDERKRIARDIHDDLGQNLLALRMEIGLMEPKLGTSPGHQALLQAPLAQIDHTIQTVRNIINDLRPAVLDLGLGTAIEWQVREFQRRTKIPCETAIQEQEFELADRDATALFRIFQEGLTNIARHARAGKARVTLCAKDGELVLTIADDGIGLPLDADRKTGGFGLVGIEERIHALGGKFAIWSKPGEGTMLTVTFPLLTTATEIASSARQDTEAEAHSVSH